LVDGLSVTGLRRDSLPDLELIEAAAAEFE
jgi:hypothetical protein